LYVNVLSNIDEYYIYDNSFVTMTIVLSTHLALSTIPQYLHPKFEAMIEEYLKTKMIKQIIQ
jgi:hypothetical protein